MFLSLLQTVFWDASLVAALDILAQLNKLNHSIEGLKVPYDTFHLANLDQYVDIRIDYVSWLTDAPVGYFLMQNIQ